VNKFDPNMGLPGLATLQFLDGEYRVVKAGSYVLCAVSGKKILLDDLRYWSVERQEAYATSAEAIERFRDKLSD
jgi:hypothetical protein